VLEEASALLLAWASSNIGDWVRAEPIPVGQGWRRAVAAWS